MIEFGWFDGHNEKGAHSEGWVEFQNREDKSGAFWIQGHNMGEYLLTAGQS